MNAITTMSTHRLLTTRDATAESFFIVDSSPMISYAPPGAVSPWTAGYSRQPDGYDETLHLTTMSESTLSFNITATSFTLLMPAYQNCLATLSINSSTPIPACTSNSTSGETPFALYNLPLGVHSVEWSSNQISGGEQAIFWGIDAARPGDTSSSMTNLTIDDSYTKPGTVELIYQGDWTSLSKGSPSGMSEVADLDRDFNQTLSVTQAQGASVSFTGSGSAVYVYGTVGPDYGSASLSLNGQMVAPNLNLTSPWALNYQLLWMHTGLDGSQSQNITLTNLASKKMALDFVLITADTSVLASLGGASAHKEFVQTLAGKLVYFLVIPLTVLCLLGTVIYFACIRRRIRSKRDSRDSALSLRPEVGTYEKRPPSRGARSDFSNEEVFVSYDEARGQRMSPRWQSPSSPDEVSSSGSASVSYRLEARTISRNGWSRPEGGTTSRSESYRPALPESEFSPSPITENSSHPSWSRPFASILGSRYSRSDYGSNNSRRATALPAYTPGENGTYDTNGSSPTMGTPWLATDSEKAAVLRSHLGEGSSGDQYAGGLSSAHPYTPANLRESTEAPSEIMSVFGQPPSERDSVFSTATLPQIFSALIPPPNQSQHHNQNQNQSRPHPTLDTSFLHRQRTGPQSATSPSPSPSPRTLRIPSAAPLLSLKSSSPFGPPSAFSLKPEDWPESDNGFRTRTGSMKSGLSEAVSAARPDSDVMPFERFVKSLHGSERSARI